MLLLSARRGILWTMDSARFRSVVRFISTVLSLLVAAVVLYVLSSGPAIYFDTRMELKGGYYYIPMDTIKGTYKQYGVLGDGFERIYDPLFRAAHVPVAGRLLGEYLDWWVQLGLRGRG
jgi:hypothetical protein